MHLTQITCLLLFLLTTHQVRADDDSSTETNEIIPREAIQKLDFSVRQALLRAIDKLEKEANDEVSADAVNNDDPETEEENEEVTTIQPTTITIQSTTALPLTTQQTKDEILEESTSSSDIFPSVQFFTATYDENHAQEQPLAAFIDKSKTTFKKFNKNFGSPVVVATDVKEETPDNHQAARSVANANNNNNNVQSNEISLNGLDEIKFEIRNTKLSHKPQTTTTTTEVYTTTTTTTPRPRTTKKRKPTTTTTTTTTTPRPTHNEDGENIEIVEKDDIRIQAAPLVSAFTVDLDEQGAAKKVVPIIDRPAATVATAITSTQRTSSIFRPPLFGPTITKLNVLQAEAQRSAALSSSNNLSPTAVPTQATFGSSTSANIFSNIVPTSGHYITKQPLSNINQQQHQQQQNQQQQQQQGGNVNNYLLEKQRELEQQIYQLKLQAQQQQELIIRQIKLLEEQSKLRNTQATAQATNTILQTQTQLSQQQQQQQSQRPQQLPLVQQEPGFTIRPSVEFIPSTQTKSAPIYQAFSLEQQLPLKESNGKYIKNNGFSNSGLQNQQQQQQPQQQQQELPNPIQQVFQNLRNLHQTNSQAAASISSIQIQPSNQLNIVPTFSSATSSQSSAILQQTPAELSHVQALPQRNYQQFQQNPLVPQYVTNALLERQQQQQQQQNQQQQHQARFFRQEGETGNFGVNQVQIQPSNNIFSSYNQDQQQQQQQQQSNTFDNQNFYRQHLIPEFSNQLQQNAQQYYQQQQQQQQQTSQTGNYFKHQQQQRFHNNRLNSLTNNLEEFNIINKVLALNHGINNFAQQQSSAPTLSTQSQSARFSSNIF